MSTENATLSLAPSVKLRNERTRVLIYTTARHYGFVDKFLFIHPAWAVLLALMDGTRTLAEVASILCYTSNITAQSDAEALVHAILDFLSNKLGRPVISKSTGSNSIPVHNPFEFIIPSNNVDLRKGRRLECPLSLNYITTDTCFRKCIYCFAELDRTKRQGVLPFARVQQLLHEAQTMEVNDIGFSGGDPFARPDIVEIIESTIDAGITPFISTKACLHLDVCRRLRDAGLAIMQVSIDSADPAVAAFLTGSPNCLREIEQTIRNLRASGIEVIAKCVLTPYNATDIRSLLVLLSRLDVTVVNLSPYGRSVFRHTDDLVLDGRDLTRVKEQVADFTSANSTMEVMIGSIDDYPSLSPAEQLLAFSNRSGCGAGSSTLTILPDGKVLFCEQLPSREEFIVGDLRTHSLAEVWTSDRMKEVLLPPRDKFKRWPCHDCEEFHDCHMLLGRCLRDAYSLYHDAYAPDPKCPRLLRTVRLI